MQKGIKKVTYVKTPLGTPLGTHFGVILGWFWGRFGVHFGMFLKCFFVLVSFVFPLLCFLGVVFSYVFPSVFVVEAMREAHGRRPHDMLNSASKGHGKKREREREKGRNKERKTEPV